MPPSPYFTGTLDARMAEDLHLGGMSERTHAGYLRAVRKLADDSQIAPDKKISEDQLCRFFLHMKNDLHDAHGTLRVAYSGIKFFSTRTCQRDWQTPRQRKLQHVKSLPRPTSGRCPDHAQASPAARSSLSYLRAIASSPLASPSAQRCSFQVQRPTTGPLPGKEAFGLAPVAVNRFPSPVIGPLLPSTGLLEPRS